MKNSPWIIALICVTTLAGHVIIQQRGQIQQLQVSSDLADKARNIDNDQIRDLLYRVQELKTEQESIKTQAYVSGVVAALDDKEHYHQIWHDGYDRGTEVQTLAYKSETEQIRIQQLKKELNLESPLKEK